MKPKDKTNYSMDIPGTNLYLEDIDYIINIMGGKDKVKIIKGDFQRIPINLPKLTV